MDTNKDSIEIIKTKPSTRIKPVLTLIITSILTIGWFALGWTIGFYMAKSKFKQPINIVVPQKYDSILVNQ